MKERGKHSWWVHQRGQRDQVRVIEARGNGAWSGPLRSANGRRLIGPDPLIALITPLRSCWLFKTP